LPWGENYYNNTKLLPLLKTMGTKLNFLESGGRSSGFGIDRLNIWLFLSKIHPSRVNWWFRTREITLTLQSEYLWQS
jgi:hypothetical protein